jgi:predicted alpha/beta-hydrolase family hydrolase
VSRAHLTISLDHPRVETARAILDQPVEGERERAILLAHGAGAPMEHPFMESVATGLATRGFPVLRFEYPYMARAREENRRMPPDRLPALTDAHRRALALLREHTGSRPLLLAGKSMGARISTLLAAGSDEEDGQGPLPCAGLVLFGYPLHPAGKPERLRRDHFPRVTPPTLFFQGTRDALCDLALLESSLADFAGEVTVHVVEGADHSFHVPRRYGQTDLEVIEVMLDDFASWEANLT